MHQCDSSCSKTHSIMDPDAIYPEAAIDEELTDEQIDQLVEQAQRRLSAPAPVPADYKYGGLPLSKPARSELPQSYVDTDGKVARLNSEGTLTNLTKRKAYGVRKIEDPVVAKKKTQEVCSLRSCPCSPTSMRKINHIISLEQTYRLRHGCLPAT